MTTVTEQRVETSALRLTFRDVDPARFPLPAMSELDFEVDDLRLGRCVRVLDAVNVFCVTVDLAAVVTMREANQAVLWLRSARHRGHGGGPHGSQGAGHMTFEDFELWHVDVEPTVRTLSMRSPLVVDLVTRVSGAGGLAATAAYLFKHPEQIGSWLPRIRASWYDAQAEAEKARRAHELLMHAGMEVEDSQD